MNIIKILHLIFALASGVLLIGYGGMDDSPGAQGIGLLTAIGSVLVFAHMFLLKNLGKRSGK
ncbi:MAG: hypothetical protein PHT84_00945 [Candidatus Pacebacteria bacterium]|jgi:drug/metabolite transporter (DMT)-like permease|nr:hypothetical protein [Candidatus Paceibacterota bacterium]